MSFTTHLRLVALLCTSIILPTLALGAEADVDVETLRAASRSAIMEGCTASFIDRGLERALQRARESNQTEAKEEDLRRIARSERMRAVAQTACRCVFAETLARVDRGSTVTELTTISKLIDWTAAYEAMDDQHCIANLKTLAPVPTRPRPMSPRWQKVGSWPDGDGFVDAGSVKWLAPEKAQAWIRAVFTAPKTAPNGKSFTSMEVLETFDCHDGTLQSLSYSGYSDSKGATEVYAGDRADDEAPLERVEADSRQGVARDWVCGRRVSH